MDLEKSRPPDLTCQEISQIVTDYLEGAMSAADRGRFDDHLSQCPDCVRYIAQMRATVRTLGRVPAEPIPPEIERRLVESFRNWKLARS